MMMQLQKLTMVKWHVNYLILRRILITLSVDSVDGFFHGIHRTYLYQSCLLCTASSGREVPCK